MSLVEEYYELNEAEKVSSSWKVLQIILCAFAAILGLASGFTLGAVRQKFAERCYLFTEVKMSQVKDHEKEQKIINWESDTWCDYYQFTMVSSFIVAIIWATFFLMCGTGGKSLTGLPQPWRIVWPSLIFNFIYFIIVLSTAVRIQQGTDHFCGRKHVYKTELFMHKCDPLKLLLKKDLHTTTILLEVVLKTAWGCAASWLILFLLPFFRIIFVIDFKLYKICVFKIDDRLQNKREEVLKITSYEEPKIEYRDEDEEKFVRHLSQETFKDLEVGTKTKLKFNKSERHYNTSANRFPIKRTSNFNIDADIRMVKLEEKKSNYLKALDEAFGNHSLRGERRKPRNIPPNFYTSAKSEVQAFLYEKSKALKNNEMNESEFSSTSTSNKIDFPDARNESCGEIFADEFDSSHSLRFKKQI